jgi:hypothetical protein
MKSNHKIHSEIEIETKLDAHMHYSDQVVIEETKNILEREGWEIMNEHADEKDLLYYDTSDLQFHKEGATLRQVTPFCPKKFPGTVRYDFKQGKGEIRLEAKGWSSEALSEDEIISLLCLENRVNRIKPIAQVHITPKFLDLEKWDKRSGEVKVSAELKLDTCMYYGRPLFRELELELKKGNPSEIYKVSRLLSEYFDFPIINTQKYSRVVNLLSGRGL